MAKKRWTIRRRLRGSHEQNLRHKICYFKTLGYLQKQKWSVKITKLQTLDFILRSCFILSTIFSTLIWFISMYYWKFIPRFRSWVEFSNFVMFTLWMGIRRQRAKFVTFKMIKVSVYRISFWIIVKWNPSAQKKNRSQGTRSMAQNSWSAPLQFHYDNWSTGVIINEIFQAYFHYWEDHSHIQRANWWKEWSSLYGGKRDWGKEWMNGQTSG